MAAKKEEEKKKKQDNGTMTYGNIKEDLMTRAMLLSPLMSQAMYQNIIVNSTEAGPSSRLQAGWFVNASFGHAKQYSSTNHSHAK